MFSGLTKDTIHSLIGYMNAPAMEKRCLYVIAMRTDPADLKQYREAFYDADSDGDGKISRIDLNYLLQQSWRLFSLWVNEDALFEALDVTSSGVITFTEFVAACLYARLSPLDSWLAEQAFDAMDLDKDGLVHPNQVRKMFGVLPEGLPTNRPICANEWLGCLLGGKRGHFGAESRTSTGAKSAEPSSAEPSFFQKLFFTGCCMSKADEHMIEPIDMEPLFDEPDTTGRPLPPLPPSADQIDYRSVHRQIHQGGVRNLAMAMSFSSESTYAYRDTDSWSSSELSSPSYVPSSRSSSR